MTSEKDKAISSSLFVQIIPLAPLLALLKEQHCDVDKYSICISHDGKWRAISKADLERMGATN